MLPYYTLYLGPRSVLILNNASIYKSIQLQKLCKEHGVLLKFLLPYSPDFNPIEVTFNDLKAWIKRHYWLMEDFVSFKAFLYFAIEQVCGTHVKEHFKEAGYVT